MIAGCWLAVKKNGVDWASFHDKDGAEDFARELAKKYPDAGGYLVAKLVSVVDCSKVEEVKDD
jgi:hypothetical protein